MFPAKKGPIWTNVVCSDVGEQGMDYDRVLGGNKTDNTLPQESLAPACTKERCVAMVTQSGQPVGSTGRRW